MHLKNKIPIIFCLIFLTSCNEFQRILKSEDIKLKYEVISVFSNKDIQKIKKILIKNAN